MRVIFTPSYDSSFPKKNARLQRASYRPPPRRSPFIGERATVSHRWPTRLGHPIGVSSVPFFLGPHSLTVRNYPFATDRASSRHPPSHRLRHSVGAARQFLFRFRFIALVTRVYRQSRSYYNNYYYLYYAACAVCQLFSLRQSLRHAYATNTGPYLFYSYPVTTLFSFVLKKHDETHCVSLSRSFLTS